MGHWLVALEIQSSPGPGRSRVYSVRHRGESLAAAAERRAVTCTAADDFGAGRDVLGEDRCIGYEHPPGGAGCGAA